MTTRHSLIVLALTVLLAASLFPASLAAQDVPSHARGLDAAPDAHGNGPDFVNLFNGNLVVEVPIGHETPIGPSFGLGLRAVYNANSWDFETAQCNGQVYEQAIADPQANAGFGWMVHLGVLVPPDTNSVDTERWSYVAADGSRRSFYDSLHPGYPSTPREDVLYANDSSYLRLRLLDGDDPACTSPGGTDCYLLEHPDGAIHEFRDGPDGSPRLVRLRDAFDNRIDVVYLTGGTTWELRDSHGRRQRMVFGGPAGSYARLERVELTSFGGGTAVYDFVYQSATLDRQRQVGPACAATTLDTDLLTRVVLPDGSYWSFTYLTSDDAPEYLSGGLASLRLPTGGSFAWRYTPIPFRSQDPEGEIPERFAVALGVSEKTITPLGGQPPAVWRYGYTTSGAAVPGDVPNVPCHHVTTVTDPLGNDTEHFFSTSYLFHRWSYGLPFTRCADGYDDDAPFLSARLWQGGAGGGELMRSVWVDYESDGAPSGEHQEKNPRMVFQRTVFHDDGDRRREVRYQDFDGLGQYRTVTVDGDLGGDARSVEIDWNPTHGTLVIDPETGNDAGSSFTLPDPDAPWRLDRFSTRTVHEAGERATVEQCFDDTTGFLTRMRILAGDGRAAHDLLATFDVEIKGGRATGFVARERFYGGDAGSGTSGGSLGGGALCNLALPSRPRYQVDHRWTAGTLSRSSAVDPATGVELLRLHDVDIDLSTGLPRTVRDAAGTATTLVHDPLGRLIAVRPEADAWVAYEHRLPTIGQPSLTPRTTVTACAPGQSTCGGDDLLGWRRDDLDGLGRTVSEQIRIPTDGGIEEQVRVLGYDTAGNLVSAGSWNSPYATLFTGHDRFGRPARVEPASGPDVALHYLGERALGREALVMRSDGRIDPVWRTEIMDLYGRLTGVCEAGGSVWNGVCDGSLTHYDHDLGDRLTRVCTDAVGSSCGQERLLIHDQRGFLVAERHPELGPSGNGWVSYRHDAFGNVVEKTVADETVGGKPVSLRYTFDGAGRPTAIDEVIGGVARPLESFVYGTSNQGTDRRAGKLVSSSRHNRIPIGLPLKIAGGGFYDAVVSQHFTYAGRGGRVSSRQTHFTLGGTEYRFDTGFSWDASGEIEHLDYPTCLQGGCDAPARRVTHRRQRGLLTAIDGFADDIRYQAGGYLHQVRHANGTLWTLDLDPASGLQRPHRISSDRGLDVGPYAYDGSGQIYEMGGDRFRYDDTGRLLHGDMNGSGQSATWDSQGNLTSLERNGTTGYLPVDVRTNRLTDASYDAAGRMRSRGGQTYRYDAGGALLETRGEDRIRHYLYDADDERIAFVDCAPFGCDGAPPVETWTVRDLDGRVLRTFRHQWGGGWQWQSDVVHRDAVPLAMVVPSDSTSDGESVFHLHPDHLGTPRQVTDERGQVVADLDFLPFGQESSTIVPELRLRFTGHERDTPVDDGFAALDYLHARYTDVELGRFLTPDPLLGDPRVPRSWNRYTYGLGDPLRYVDRFGMRPQLKFSDSIVVYASDGSETGIVDRLFYGQQWYYNLGSSVAPPPRVPVRMLPQVVGRAPCRDFGCRVMAGIGRHRRATEALELAVTEVSMLWLAAPLELLNLGGTAARVGGQATVRSAATTGVELSAHAAAEMTERGVTRAMVRRAIERGTRYFDRRTGTIAHVLDGGMASGRSLVVTTNPFTGQVATVTRMRAFQGAARYGGQARYLAVP